MDLIKRIFGFYSPYSWTKYLRIGAIFVALLFTVLFGGQFLGMGLFGVVLFLVFFGPAIAICMGLALLIGAIVGGAQSGKRQAQSLEESQATGSMDLLELDRLRIKVQRLNTVFWIIVFITFIGGGIIATILEFTGASTVGGIIFCVVGGVAILVLAIVKAPMNRRYKAGFKEEVVRKGLEAVLDNVDFEPKKALDEVWVKDSRLFSSYDIYSGNDYLSASYDGIHFIQSDVHLQNEHEETYEDSDGDRQTRTTYTTVFQGTFSIFDYDAISNDPVFVFDKRMRKNVKNPVQTELEIFNRKFSVVADSAMAAFHILTPPVMEGIVLAEEKLRCPISLSFLNDKLYVAVENGDSFEAITVGNMTISEQRARVQRQIQSMLDMVGTIYIKK